MKSLSPEQLGQVTRYLEAPRLAHLATLDPETLMPHVVPVWYLWDGTAIWINAYASTLKVRQLHRNPNCAVVVDGGEDEPGLMGVLFKGQAEILDGPPEFMVAQVTAIYQRYLSAEEVAAPDPQEWIHSPEARLLRIEPRSVSLF